MSDDILEQLQTQLTPVEPPRAFLAAVNRRRIRRRIVRTTVLWGVILVGVVAAFMVPMGPTTQTPGPDHVLPPVAAQPPVHLPESSWARLIRDNRDLPPERMVLGSGQSPAPSKPMGVRNSSTATLGL